MKNLSKFLGITVLIAVVGFSMIACGGGGGGGKPPTPPPPDDKYNFVITGIPSDVDANRLLVNGELSGSLRIYPTGTTQAQALAGANIIAESFLDKLRKDFARTSSGGSYTYTFPLYDENPTRWGAEPEKDVPWKGSGTYDVYFVLDNNGGYTYRFKNVKFTSETTTVSFADVEDLTLKYTDASGTYSYFVEGSKIIISGYEGNVATLVIPSMIDGKYVTEIYGYGGYSSATSVTFPSQLEVIGNGVFNQSGLTSVTIPNTVKTIKSWGVFAGSPNLASVTFQAGSKLESIGGEAFYKCTSLTTIEIPRSVKRLEDWGSFSDCTNLASVTFEAGSQLQSIAGGAFINCKLTSITIPTTVTSIDGGAFVDNPLLSITIGENVTLGGWSSFPGNFDYFYNDVYDKEAGTYIRDSVDDDYWYIQ